MVINQMSYELSIIPPPVRFRHSHGGTGCGSAHKPFRPSRASFSNPSSTVSPAHILFPIPPAPAVFDQRVIDVGPIGKDHLKTSNYAGKLGGGGEI